MEVAAFTGAEVTHRRWQVRENMERLRSCASLDRGRAGAKTWQSILELTDRELASISALQTDLPHASLERIANHFQLGTDELWGDRIDFREIAIRHDDDGELPAPYRVAAFGRRRATMTSLDYVEKKSGWRVRRDVFRRFGVNERMFSDPMAPISMSFLTEVGLHMARRYGYTRDDLRRMGANLYTDGRSPLLESVFSRCQGPSELYSRFFGDMMKFFELNCHYVIQELDGEHCVFDVLSRSEVAEALRVRHLGNQELCSVKAGFISSMTAYLGMPFAKISELSCVHRGDAACRYELRYPEAKRPS